MVQIELLQSHTRLVTPLAAEAMPIFRYRTGQVVMRLDEPCPCGRTLTRLANPTEYAGVVWQAMP